MKLRLLLDTGATTTTFSPEFVRLLQLETDTSVAETEMVAMTGSLSAKFFILPRLRSLGHAVNNLSIAAVNIPPEAGVDGVLGFDYLKRFRIGINAARGLVVAQSLERSGFLTRLRDRMEWMRIA